MVHRLVPLNGSPVKHDKFFPVIRGCPVQIPCLSKVGCEPEFVGKVLPAEALIISINYIVFASAEVYNVYFMGCIVIGYDTGLAGIKRGSSLVKAFHRKRKHYFAGYQVIPHRITKQWLYTSGNSMTSVSTNPRCAISEA